MGEAGGGDGDQEAFRHRPVMVAEVTELLGPVPPGPVVDATVGAGGHARALLEAHAHVDVVGLDQDADALSAAAAALRPFADRVVLRRARFDHMTMICEELGHRQVSGVLFDLGVSSPQLDRAERGFSYGTDGPLDMRMDRGQRLTAADVVNTYDEDALTRVLAAYGDERFARRIARAIVAARPLSRTTELAEVVRSAIPAPARRRGGHPARRTFQAIRIEVNRELEILPAAIDQAIDLLRPRGRCVVLAYHSGEDRIVKQRFAEAVTGGCVCPPGLPCACGAEPRVRLLRRGSRPTAAEVEANPRSESARLRAVEKLPDEVAA
ncbi:MAG TPA: 16S rRNA (cytosine(1402)-N(4))-methyltransferase RsmH [Acidimicrobiales bacterium]|nr:16S rRNA (cytosine(1402)-N(4))-methyltransferase RsmH [Acidimicrobiales bacterium]